MMSNDLVDTKGWLPSPAMTPHQWMGQHRRIRQLFGGPKDSRIPAFLSRVTGEVCALRFSLEQVRLAFEGRPEALTEFQEALEGESSPPVGAPWVNAQPRLIGTFLSRIDWRELDILEMVLDCLRELTRDGGLSNEAPGGESDFAQDLMRLEELRGANPHGYELALQGLISEMRGSQMGILEASQSLGSHPNPAASLDERVLRLLVDGVARSCGISAGAFPKEGSLPDDPRELWEDILSEARGIWSSGGISLPLKPFEKASLYLMESLSPGKTGHGGFVRHLIENEDAYRRVLSTYYAPLRVQAEVLSGEVDRYNRLPEHVSRRFHLSDQEARLFLYGFMIRPDVVAAIAERERQKDIYRAIPGLSSKAHLPRVLHEIQNIFGYITPEAVKRVVDLLGVDPVDVIRLIASYKQFSADRGGDIVIYICKGTACFLRGQPELSREIADEIMAGEGEVGKHGIQFIEMDCFGVCHLAPVIKARNTFLGKRESGDVPEILERLLKGPSYENRLIFLERIQRMLAQGHQSQPLKSLRIERVIHCKDGGNSGVTLEELAGQCLQIDASGSVFALENGNRQLLGHLIPHSLCFAYETPDRTKHLGALVLDSSGEIQSAVHLPFRLLHQELRKTLKPRGYVEAGAVWVERFEGPYRLGSYTANALVLSSGDGAFRVVELSGTPSAAPPEREEGLAVHGALGHGGDDQEFEHRQDRLLLGFAAGADPEDVDSYMEKGGYRAVRRALGLDGEPPWTGREIVDRIAAARLRGRGGAGFPTGRKWEAMRQAKCAVLDTDGNRDPIKLIVANGDEGDPGAFMDRTLIQERPHQVIEGMILSAIAVEARYGVIYVRKEYEDAVRRLENAIFQARRKGYLGEDIFGVEGLDFDLDIRLGAGAFVAGEKRAIMRAIEGEAAEPTLNAGSNTTRGLWGKPTLLNNVETFANVPLILERGEKWYASQGTEHTGGTKIFSVAGIVKRTGLVEVRFGRTLQDIIAICGGIQEGKILAGVQIGGPSGAILSLTGIRSYLLYTPLDFDAFDRVGAMLGSGGLVFIGEDDDVVRLARHFTDWLAEESCGQCPACFQGTRALGANLDVVLHGEGTSDRLHALWAKSDAIKAGSQCGLGMTASNPVTSALRFFPHAFLHYVLRNPRLDRMELFKVLEALRLITRENVERISGRRRMLVGHSFTLKRHLMRNVVAELERLDRHRPTHQRQKERFLDLLELPAHEVGMRDAVLECSLDEGRAVGNL